MSRGARVEHRQPTLADIRGALDRGRLVWVSADNDWDQVDCHAVLVYGQRGTVFDVYRDTVAPTHALTGLRLLNPGSPTDRRCQPTCSWMTAEIDDGQLCRVRLHRPDSR